MPALYNSAMFMYPQIDPVALEFASIRIHWYGIMYVIGFFAFLALGHRRARNAAFGISQQWVGDIMFYGVFGVIIGGRVGYILFYQWDALLSDWTLVFRIWEGGMSFHGGLIGVVCALWLFARKQQQPLLKMLDFCAPMVPIGLGAGRVGNFINGELWGRPTELPWAMVFPYVDQLPRHPSQLYEVLLEGVLLFIILWCYSRQPRPLGMVSGLFAVGYGVLRFLVEFTRAPDTHIGFVVGDWMTMGQLLSVLLVSVGIMLMLSARKNNKAN